MAISPTSAAAAQLPPRLASAVPANEAMDSGVTPLLAVPAPDTSRITLRAAADTWLQVKDRAGTVLLNRVLKTGETWAVPPRNDLLLTTGNAGGTEILVDGAATAALGGNGAVRRDLTLDPVQIKDGKLAVAAAAPAAPRPRQ
jgi:cytoskeleton protein RodZ